MLKDDWLMRMIHQLVEVIARAAGLAREGRSPEAKRELEQAYNANLGMPKRMLDRLDAATAFSMLGPDKSKLLVMILQAEADVATAEGDATTAAERRARALAVQACGSASSSG